MISLLFLIIGLVLFVSLVALHEAGHAIVARWHGVEVEEYGIGFPPRLWGKKLGNGMLLSVNLLPLGGFVRLKGEHDAATGPGTYGAANLWAKAQILLAGVAVNWLLAALIFTILAFFGLPEVLPNQFSIPSDTTYVKDQIIASQIIPGSPAEKAGLHPNDSILAVNSIPITSADQLAHLTKGHAGQTVTFLVDRNGSTKTFQVRLNSSDVQNQGYAGIGMAEEVIRRSTWSAPIVGVAVTGQFTAETIKGLGVLIGELFNRQFQAASQNVTGPVGIFTILQKSSQVGFVPVLFLIGIISLTLAVMNTLPIPALDGGRLFITLIAHLLRKPLSKEREETIQAIGFIALMGLVVLITIVDVGRLIGGK